MTSMTVACLLLVLAVVLLENQANSFKLTKRTSQLLRSRRDHNSPGCEYNGPYDKKWYLETRDLHSSISKRRGGHRKPNPQESICDEQADICGSHGTCKDCRKWGRFWEGYHCLCDDGWMGDSCDQQDPCAGNNPCQNNGTCFPEYMSPGKSWCYCEGNYHGDTCEKYCGINQCLYDFYEDFMEIIWEDPSDMDESCRNVRSALKECIEEAGDGICTCASWDIEEAMRVINDEDAEKWIEEECKGAGAFFTEGFDFDKCELDGMQECGKKTDAVWEMLYNDFYDYDMGNKRKRNLIHGGQRDVIDEAVQCLMDLQKNVPDDTECPLYDFYLHMDPQLLNLTWTMDYQGCPMDSIEGSCDFDLTAKECSEGDIPEMARGEIDCAMGVLGNVSGCEGLSSFKQVAVNFATEEFQARCTMAKQVGDYLESVGCAPEQYADMEVKKKELKSKKDSLLDKLAKALGKSRKGQNEERKTALKTLHQKTRSEQSKKISELTGLLRRAIKQANLK